MRKGTRSFMRSADRKLVMPPYESNPETAPSMVHLLRRFQQPLMIAVTLLVIVSFTWFYSRNDFLDKAGAGQFATIYGRSVSFTQAQRVGRKFDLCQDLGLFELLQSLAIRRQDAKENFIWNSMVLQHESERLGIEATDDEVFAATQAMAIFQTNGAYDSSKYNMIVQGALSPRGFTPDDMTELIRDDLRLKKIKALLGATVAPSENEARQAFAELNQKTEASVVRLKLDDFLATAQVAEDDVKKFYEERKAGLQSDEMRKVKFVAFVLPTTDKPLENKERVDTLAKLSKQAEDFSVAMTEKTAKFGELAEKLGVKVEESPEFTLNQPPPQLEASAEVARAAFKLTQQEPNSDVIGTDRGYFVLQLSGITPARPLTFDEAKERLTDSLKRERAQEALNLKATEIRNKIDADIKAGKSFADAAQAAGVKAESFPPFSRKEPQFEAPNSGEIMSTAAEMNEGQLSPVVPTANGGVILHVGKRPPIDEAKFQAEKAQVIDGVAEFKRTALFQEWLKLRRTEAQLKLNVRG